MRWLLVFLCLASAAQAQTGSVKTPAALAAEINALFPDNTSNLITPGALRQVVLDMVASAGSLAPLSPSTWPSLQTFSGGIAGPCMSTVSPPFCDAPVTPTWTLDSKGRTYWTQLASASLPISPINGTGFTLTGVPGSFPGIMHFAWAISPGPNLGTGTDVFQTAHGSPGAETILQAGDTIGAFSFRGWTDTGYTGNVQAAIRAIVPANWSPGNYPTAIAFYTMPPNGGSTLVSQALGVYTGVIIGSSTTDPGAGNLLVGGRINAAALPTAPVVGPGLSNVCVDTGGYLYRKATCP